MIRALTLAALFASALVPGPAAAHPHIFIDTALRLTVENGKLTAVRVSWTYDELYSLITLEDRGLDSDFDGVLTPDEEARLAGFDLNWVAGFEGDLYIQSAGAPAVLGPPRDGAASVTDGKITSSHTRALTPPVAVPLTIRAFDPTYYTAYAIDPPIEVGARCEVDIEVADLAAAYALVDDILYGPKSTEYEGDNFPAVGQAFADTIHLTCGGA